MILSILQTLLFPNANIVKKSAPNKISAINVICAVLSVSIYTLYSPEEKLYSYIYDL